MIASYSNGLGIGFDSLGFDETEETVFDLLPRGSLSSLRKRTTYGWGAYGARVFSRPQEFVPISRQIGVTSPGTITIASASGALSDTIRTDVRRPLLHTLEFTNGEGGCADFQFTLHRMPPFPLLPFSLVSIRVGDGTFDWYSGVLNYPDFGGIGIGAARAQKGPFKFSGKGLTQYLNTNEAQTTFAGGPSVDVTDIVRQIVQAWIVPYAPISYNENKILADAAVPLLHDIDTSRTPIGKTLEILADMAKCRFGVDGDRDFFFVPYEDEPTAVYFVGYDFHGWEPTQNMDAVVNYWLLTRNGQSGSAKAGWNVGGVFSDEPSQKKNGFKKGTKQFPGYWSDETFDVVGANLLERFKDPQPAGTATHWVVPSSGIRFIPVGRCYVVEPPAKNWTIFDDLDDASIWTGPAFADATNLMWSSRSIRIDHPGIGSDSDDSEADSDDETIAYMFKSLEFFGKITKLAFYVECSRTGVIGSFGFGDGAWNNYTAPLEVFEGGIFQRVEIDIESLVSGGLSRIRYFGVSIDNEHALSLYLNRLEVEIYGARWLNLEVTKVRTNPKTKELQVEFGTVQSGLPTYVRGLLASESDLKFGQEIR